MNVYGQIRKVIQEFEVADFWDDESIDTKEVLNFIRKTWTYLERFIKNIEPEYTKYLTNRLQTITNHELLITKEMLSEAKRRYIGFKAEIKDVKSFITSYIGLINSLLTFNIPEEACDICQSYLYYYFNEESRVLIKKCITCGAQYYGVGNSIISFPEHYEDLRPAKRHEIEHIIKLPL